MRKLGFYVFGVVSGTLGLPSSVVYYLRGEYVLVVLCVLSSLFILILSIKKLNQFGNALIDAQLLQKDIFQHTTKVHRDILNSIGQLGSILKSFIQQKEKKHEN